MDLWPARCCTHRRKRGQQRQVADTRPTPRGGACTLVVTVNAIRWLPTSPTHSGTNRRLNSVSDHQPRQLSHPRHPPVMAPAPRRHRTHSPRCARRECAPVHAANQRASGTGVTPQGRSRGRSRRPPGACDRSNRRPQLSTRRGCSTRALRRRNSVLDKATFTRCGERSWRPSRSKAQPGNAAACPARRRGQRSPRASGRCAASPR